MPEAGERKPQGFCRNCGAQNRQDTTFCVSCGERLTEHPSTAVPNRGRLNRWLLVVGSASVLLLLLVGTAAAMYRGSSPDGSPPPSAAVDQAPEQGPTDEETTSVAGGVNPDPMQQSGPQTWEEQAQTLYQSSLTAVEDTVERFDPDNPYRDWTEAEANAQASDIDTLVENHQRFGEEAAGAPAELKEADAYLLRGLESLALLTREIRHQAIGETTYITEAGFQNVAEGLDDFQEARELVGQQGIDLDPQNASPAPQELKSRFQNLQDGWSNFSQEQQEKAEAESTAQQREQQYMFDEIDALNEARQVDIDEHDRVVSGPLVDVEVEAVGQVVGDPLTQGGPRSLEEEAAAFVLEAAAGPVWRAVFLTRDVDLIASSGIEDGEYVRVTGVVYDVDEEQGRPLVKMTNVEIVDKEEALDPNVRTFQVLNS